MKLAITLGIGGLGRLIAGALGFGVLAQLIGETRTRYGWLIEVIGAWIGARVASRVIMA